ncbi:RNA-directed DNA polymerase, eukaryota [Tanacetum coccineum]
MGLFNMVIDNWNGEVITMGDFNDVRNQAERYGSTFNIQGANAFNSFISDACLEDVTLGGCSFTWCHKSASKMSKLDRFLIFEGLMNSFRPLYFQRLLLDVFDMEGFNTLMENTWKETNISDHNAMTRFLKKLKYTKEKIREWIKVKKDSSNNYKKTLKADLVKIDSLLNKGEGNSDILNKRITVSKELQDIDKLESMEVAQKAKIKWVIEGDENSKYYHGILNKNRSQLAIRGILVNDTWIDSPTLVKNEQILDGPFILNKLFQWCKKKKKHTLIFNVDFEKAYDLVRWDYLDDVLLNFGFGDTWRGWIQSCLKSSRGSIMVNGSPTKEFQFHRGLKQGDPLSPFLLILIMESLHISVQRVVDAGMFKGITLDTYFQISHLFYVDEVVFTGQ